MHQARPRYLFSALTLPLLFTGACAPAISGRVVSDVRIANGWISIDRCQLQQVIGQGIRVRNCETENYYLGQAATPIRSSITKTFK
jgi:hypothetical protein